MTVGMSLKVGSSAQITSLCGIEMVAKCVRVYSVNAEWCSFNHKCPEDFTSSSIITYMDSDKLQSPRLVHTPFYSTRFEP